MRIKISGCVVAAAAMLWTTPASAEWTVYLDWSGTPMGPCGSNVSPSMESPGTQAAFTQEVRSVFEAFDITFTDQLPGPGPGDHVFIGPVEPRPGFNTCSENPTDCNNIGGSNRSVVPYAPGASIMGRARSLAWPIGIGLGVEATTNMADAMSAGATFVDQCDPYDTNSGTGGAVQCGPDNMADCGATDMINTHARMLAALGPAVADTAAPEVTFLNPTEGGYVDPTFDLTFDVVDNNSPQILDLLITLDDGAPIDAAGQVGPSFSFPVNNPLPVGSHTVSVEATDEDGNSTTEVIMFNVGTPPAGTDTDATTSATATGGTTSDTESSTDSDSGGSDSGGGGCTIPVDRGGPLALLLLSLLARRRRSAEYARGLETLKSG